MIGMATKPKRTTSYCRVPLEQINKDCRPNCKLPIPRKFAELMGWDSVDLNVPVGKSNLVWPSLVEDAAIPLEGVSLKVENWED